MSSEPLLQVEPSAPQTECYTPSVPSPSPSPSPPATPPTTMPTRIVSFLRNPHVWHQCLFLALSLSPDFLLMPELPDIQTTFFNGGKSCEGEMGKSSACKSAESQVALVSGMVSGGTAFLMLFASPVTGRMSDAYGRVPLLLLAQFFACLPSTCILLHKYAHFTLWLYYVAMVLTGIASPLAISLAYVADVATPQNRSTYFGIALASMSVSWCIMPLIGAQLGSLVYPVAAATSVSAFCFCMFGTPESQPKEARAPMVWTDLNPFRNLAILGRTKMFRRLSISLFLTTFATYGVEGTVVTMFMKRKFGLSQQDVAINASVFGASSTFTQSFLLKFFVSRGYNNRTIMLIGLSTAIWCYPLYGIIWTKDCMFFITAVAALGYLWFPAVSAMKANNVAESEQGTIQGALLAVRGIAMGFGPLVCSGVYDLFTSDYVPTIPAFPFYLSGVLGLCGFIVGTKVPRTNKQHVKDVESLSAAVTPDNPDAPTSDSDTETSTGVIVVDPIFDSLSRRDSLLVQ